VRYAAEDIAGTYSNGKRAGVFCNVVSRDVRSPCYEAIGALLRYLNSTPASRAAACRESSRVAANYEACLRGTRATTSIPGLNRT
jgi:hypothetical protein